MIVDTRANLDQHRDVPVVCGTCQKQFMAKNPSALIRDALHDASLLHECKQEVVLLLRTKALWDRYPGKHQTLKAGDLQLETADSNPAYDEELARDPELKEFLSCSYFQMPNRLNCVQARIADIEKSLNRAAIACSACKTGTLRIEDRFFERLGPIGVDEYIIWKFVLPQRQERYLSLLKLKKRKEALRDLLNGKDWNMPLARAILPNNQTASVIEGLLKNLGASTECYVLSENSKIDGQLMPLREALNEIVGFQMASLISCIPGTIAYYEGEGKNQRFILVYPPKSDSVNGGRKLERRAGEKRSTLPNVLLPAGMSIPPGETTI